MEEPQHAWLEHPIIKIFGRYNDYAVARRKLKEAEELTDLDSCTDQDDYLKKSRKRRAAKTYSSSSNDENEISEMDFMSDLPKVPYKHSSTERKIDSQTCNKNATKGRKDVKYVKNKSGKYVREAEDSVRSCSSYSSEIKEKNGSGSQCTENLSFNYESSNEDISRTIENRTNSKQDTQHTENFRVIAECSTNNGNIQTLNPIEDITTVFKSNSKQLDAECAKDLLAEILIDNEGNENVISPSIRRSQNLTKFIINKLIKLELKTSSIERHVKLLVQKMANNTTQPEQKEIDVFQDLPLKNKYDLESLEIKLNNDIFYRNEMVKQLTRFTCKDLRASCLHVMKQTLSNEVALYYSWYGAKKKENFSKLHICKVILSAIRKSHSNATEEDISAPLKIWLAHAKERAERESQHKK